MPICKDLEEISARAADRFVRLAEEAIEERERFAIALAGGSTPESLYRRLATPEYARRVDWSRTLLFFGDERFVAPDDARSNFGMARRTLLQAIPLPPDRLFPVPTDLPDAEKAAKAYSQTLTSVLGETGGSEPPRFDLVLLGLGDDGHTASLFPGAGALKVMDAWATFSPPGILPPPVDRITMTYPVLNAARHVFFLVAGSNKAPAVRDILRGGADPNDRPAAGIRPTAGELSWFLDESAAGRLDPPFRPDG